MRIDETSAQVHLTTHLHIQQRIQKCGRIAGIHASKPVAVAGVHRAVRNDVAGVLVAADVRGGQNRNLCVDGGRGLGVAQADQLTNNPCSMLQVHAKPGLGTHQAATAAD